MEKGEPSNLTSPYESAYESAQSEFEEEFKRKEEENFKPLVQPPPHLQPHGPTLKRCLSMSSSTPSSSLPPRSPLSSSAGAQKNNNPFKLKSQWNDDFDPFMEAMKNVKKDEKEGRRVLKRTLSMPHTWGSNHPRASSPPRASRAEGPCVTVPLPQLGEPKGVQFARRTRLVKVGNEGPNRPSYTAHPTGGKGSWSSDGLEGKGERIKKFLSRTFRKSVEILKRFGP